jgi:hypothetical protein
MLQTLGLDDDDASDALVAVEKAFDVKITAADAGQIYNVGDLFGILRGKIEGGDGDRKCASAMAFYRVRRALNDLSANAGRSPSHDLTRLHRVYTKSFVKSLEEKSGLRLPRPSPGWIGDLGVALMLGGMLGALATMSRPLVPVALVIFVGGMIVGGALVHFDRGRLPTNCRTLGALAKKAENLSFGRLVNEGADARDGHLWKALAGILADLAGVPADQIAPETYFLQRCVKRANAA